jgi:SpoVK/Ycf46/Vps4 family AAA+-type ATPase
MARSDLLLKLIKAGNTGDTILFRKVVESLVAEERSKKHFVLADQLEGLLKQPTMIPEGTGARKVLMEEKIESFLFRIYPKKSLRDVIIEEDNLKVINDLISEHHRSDLLRSYNLEPRSRVLLVGPPGNGKTSLAEAVAQSLMIPFYVIRYDGIIGSYLGETASRLKLMFDFIRTQECVLFFDEFDSIGKERGDTHETGEIKRVVSSLLLQIDRLPSYVVVIAATNHAELLDRAVWRRFQIRLELNKPTLRMIEIWLKNFERESKYKLDHSIKDIAIKLEGRNFAEIEEFIFDIRRKYILSAPDVDVYKIVDECLSDLSRKYDLRNV